MLQPKRTKYRKQMKQSRHLYGVETRGCTVAFGEFGLRALEPGWITNRQLEAARVAIARFIKRGGKVWARVFPDKPITKKAAETRMGSGKGAPEQWVAVVRSGKIIYEMTGVTPEMAKEALELAAGKLPIKCKVVRLTNTLL